MTIYNKNRYVRNTKKDTYLHTICVKRNKKDYKNDIFFYKNNFFKDFIVSLQQINNDRTMTKDINRIKVVLAEKKRTNKWLAETLGKDPATVSKWCTNSAQPGLETLLQIAECLEVDVKELINSSKNDVMYIQVTK